MEHAFAIALDRRAEAGEGQLRDLGGIGDPAQGDRRSEQRAAEHGDDLLIEDQVVHLGDCGIRVRGVVLDDDPDRPAIEAAFGVDRLLRKNQSVAFIDAEPRADARDGQDRAELDRLTRRRLGECGRVVSNDARGSADRKRGT
jgi:hypothetical protein